MFGALGIRGQKTARILRSGAGRNNCDNDSLDSIAPYDPRTVESANLDSSVTIHRHESPTDQEVRRRADELDKELKTELPQEIKRARELGDLRENAEYHAAKERQRLVEARISLLKKRVSDIHLMNIDKIPHDKVGFGSTVHLKDAARARSPSISWSCRKTPTSSTD